MSDSDKSNSQFDINDVDVAQLTKVLSEHQNTVIKIGLIIGSLILAVGMFNDYHKKDQGIHTQVSQAQAKLEAIKAHDKVVEDFKRFQSSLPPRLNEIELITLISDYARVYHVTISSLAPAESRDMGLYDLINISFSAEAVDFKKMMIFLRKIESSTFPLRVDAWSGVESEGGKMVFQVNLNAVIIHQVNLNAVIIQK